MKILIAEDEKAMQKIIALYLKNQGYDVKIAQDGQSALNYIYNEQFDLVVLDWMMPFVSGIEICCEIRKLGIPTKVVILTAKSQTEDEIKALDCGADEYIRKPFEPRILILRIKKLLNLEDILYSGDLSLNIGTQKVTKNSEEIKLSKKEYELLAYFIQNKGIILQREKLLNRVWGLDYDGDERTVDTHVKRLRTKIGDNMIITHRGLGYCMEK